MVTSEPTVATSSPSAPNPVVRAQTARARCGVHHGAVPCSMTSTRKSLPAPCHFWRLRKAIGFLVSHEAVGTGQHLDEAFAGGVWVVEPFDPRVATEPRSLATSEAARLGQRVAHALLEWRTLFDV